MTVNGNPNSHRDWVLAALDQYERRLTRYAARVLRSDDLACDAVQHTFLRLCDKQPDELGDRLAPWLFTVCRNKALDILRRNGRDESAGREFEESTIGREPNPAVSVELCDIHAGLRRLVDELPDGQRETIDLWLEGFTYREIARITKRNEGSVRVVVHRALIKLREHPWTRRLLEQETVTT